MLMTTELPKIYCFANAQWNTGDVGAIALAEDGHVLGSHICSHEAWILEDLGVRAGARSDRHETYAKHYPHGYEMVFVPQSEVEGHAGIAEAYRLNHLLPRETEEVES